VLVGYGLERTYEVKTMALILVYPAAADNNYKKYYVCYRLMKKLLNVHNTYGEKFKNEEITEEQWKLFLSEWYDPRENLVVSEILRLRKLAKNKNWNIDLDDIFVEE
jgi:hypothetical protein